MKLAVSHRTRFTYDAHATQAVTRACLTPRDTPQQTCLSSRLSIHPEPDDEQSVVDRYGNHIVLFDFAVPHDRAEIVAVSQVNTLPPPPLPADCSIVELAAVLAARHGQDMLLAEEFRLFSRLVTASSDPAALLHELDVNAESSHGVLAFAERLTNHIFSTFKYDPGYSNVATPLDDVLDARRGVCQDFAHVAILACRKLGIPARYVSGYLETLPPPGVEKLRGADASHAWFSVYNGDGHWVDFDPTNNKRPDEQYVTTAWGRDYGDVAPLRGVVYGGGKQELAVAVDVDRLPESSDDFRISTLTPR